jgi:hypothetical protein
MKAKTYTEACDTIVYPAFVNLYDVKAKDKNSVVVNKLHLTIAPILAQREHLDIFACSLLNTCRTVYMTLSHSSKQKRGTLDTMVRDVMEELNELLASHNRNPAFGHIKNEVGGMDSHYTFRVG